LGMKGRAFVYGSHINTGLTIAGDYTVAQEGGLGCVR